MSGVDFDRREGRSTGVTKAANPTPLAKDVEELGFAFVRALRDRGHTVHATEFIVWKTPKVLALDPVICISVPPVAVTQ